MTPKLDLEENKNNKNQTINKNTENRFSADGTENVGERVGYGGAKRAMAVIKE